jgi:predicted Zn-dependent protease
MLSLEEVAKGRTIAEAQGMTAELGNAIARLAAGELEAGRLDTARAILEGLAVTNPRDPAAWTLLAQLLRRQGEIYGARLCAEAAIRLAPEESEVRLARAEVLLLIPAEAGAARDELAALARSAGGPAGDRARTLLAALGP